MPEPSDSSAEAPSVLQRISLARLLSFGALVGVILLLSYVLFRVMAGFLLPLFLAVLLVVIFRPLHEAILVRCRGHQRIAAALTTLAVLLIVLVPLGWIGTLAVTEGAALVRRLDTGAMRERMTKLRQRLGLEMPHADELRRIDSAIDALFESEPSPRPVSVDAVIDPVLERLPRLRPGLGEDEEFVDSLQEALERIRQTEHGSIERVAAVGDARFWFGQIKERLLGGPIRRMMIEWANPSTQRVYELRDQATSLGQRWLAPLAADTATYLLKLILGLVILGVGLYYFLADGPALLAQLLKLSPLDNQYERELLAEFDQISRAVVLATLLSALAQGALAGLGYWVVGFESVFLMILVTVILALVPFVGAATLWIPACLWLLLYEERTGAAIGLALYGALVVSLIDNIIKPAVLHGRSKLHPLLALLSVLGGVTALGPIGIFVGPMVVAFLQALLNIMHRELLAISGKDGEPAVQREKQSEHALAKERRRKRGS